MSRKRTHRHTIPAPNDDRLKPFRRDGKHRIHPVAGGYHDPRDPVLLVVAPSPAAYLAFLLRENIDSAMAWMYSTMSQALENAEWAARHNIKHRVVVLPPEGDRVPW